MSELASSRTGADDANVLLGFLALQNNFITQETLIAGMKAWLHDKGKPLGQILLEQGHLTPQRYSVLEALAREHLQMRQESPHRSLEGLDTPISCKPDTAGSAGGERHGPHFSTHAQWADFYERVVGLSAADLEASLAHLAPFDDPALTDTLPLFSSAREGTASGLRYRRIRSYAKGGLGEVFVAEDQELHRQVALKEIQLLRAGEPVSRNRFILEAEITGSLEHPGIVPVYGLGQYHDGRPFYAMRFIQGETLTQAIERFHKADVGAQSPGERNLALRQLLSRFVVVCNTIAYAHSRGVVHRDIKPANIMFGKYGETLVVDWGLAKLVGKSESPLGGKEEKLRPASHSRVPPAETGAATGTAPFMSPEQAAGQWNQVGPASDIYSLGATLYTLLTGQVPFPGQRAEEVLEKVKRGEFLPPRQVNKETPAALDAVCRKAMALVPADRYETAIDLAGDVENWMADKPVTAWREPWTTRARRWLGQHGKLASAAAATVFVAVVCLSVFTFLLAAANAREHARRTEAEENFQLAHDGVERYFINVSESPQLKSFGLESLRKELLQYPKDFYEKLAQVHGDNRQIQDKRGWAYLRLSAISAEMDSYAEAIAHAQHAYEIFQQLRRDNPTHPAYQHGLATALHHLGFSHSQTGETAPAKDYFEEAAAILERLVKEHADNADYQDGLGKTLHDLGYWYQRVNEQAEAIPIYEEALDVRKRLAKDYPAVSKYRAASAASLSNLGLAYLNTKQRDQAKTAFEESKALCNKLVEQHSDVPIYRDQLAKATGNLGTYYAHKNNPDQARSMYEEVLQIYDELAGAHPAVPENRYLKAKTLYGPGLLSSSSPADRAKVYYERALPIFHRLVRDHEKVREYKDDLAAAALALAKLRARSGEHDRAISLLTEDFEKTGPHSAETLYNTACVYVISFTAVQQDSKLSKEERDKLANSYRLRARGLLAEAHDAGLFRNDDNFEYMRNDGIWIRSSRIHTLSSSWKR